MKPHAIALFSGGLDSTLAVCVVKEQGIKVDALHVRTMFESSNQIAEKAAASLGIAYYSRPFDDDYIEILKKPRYGYGSAVNPCIDCRMHMLRMAQRFMEETGASFVITGEVLGQRPMSQKRADFNLLEKRSGLTGRLLRPLSAKLLPPTLAELEGLVDREKLHAFSGRGRNGLLALAEKFAVEETPTPSSGCRLTEKSFAPRVRDLLKLFPAARRWDYELLNFGRHIRIDDERKIVVGRRQEDNAAIQQFAARADRPAIAHVEPYGFLGADALLLGRVDEEGIALAAALVVGYSRRAARSDCNGQQPQVRVTDAAGVRHITVDRRLTGEDFTIL